MAIPNSGIPGIPLEFNSTYVYLISNSDLQKNEFAYHGRPDRGPGFWSRIFTCPVRCPEFGPDLSWIGTLYGIRSENPLRRIIFISLNFGMNHGPWTGPK